jgi:hypothetical protein
VALTAVNVWQDMSFAGAPGGVIRAGIYLQSITEAGHNHRFLRGGAAMNTTATNGCPAYT